MLNQKIKKSNDTNKGDKYPQADSIDVGIQAESKQVEDSEYNIASSMKMYPKKKKVEKDEKPKEDKKKSEKVDEDSEPSSNNNIREPKTSLEKSPNLLQNGDDFNALNAKEENMSNSENEDNRHSINIKLELERDDLNLKGTKL